MPIAPLSSPRVLPLDHGHRMAWFEAGPAHAPAVLVLHGGPGGRTRAQSLAWFDGLGRRVVAHDQRGCGDSLPAGEIRHNTLGDLVADIERLREHLGLARWAVAGGSWGSLLAIAYAATHPDRVEGLFLRSSFLGRPAEVDAFFAHWPGWLGEAGAGWLGVPSPASDPVRLLQAGAAASGAGTGETPEAIPQVADERRRRIADAWGRYEVAQSAPGGLAAQPAARWTPPTAALPPFPAGYEIQRHYLANDCFVDEATRLRWLDALAHAMSHRPVVLVHGRADAVCDPRSSRELRDRWPGAELDEVEGGGHAMDPAPMQAALRSAAARWTGRLDG